MHTAGEGGGAYAMQLLQGDIAHFGRAVLDSSP